MSVRQTLRIPIFLALVASFALAACQGAVPAPTQSPVPPSAVPASPTPAPTQAEIMLTDGLGRAFMLGEPASRVVSLAPSNTEILFALGASSQVVGRDEFSDYPAEALEVTSIGGGFGEIDLETLVALQPDLVLAADIIAPEQIQALENLGLKVFALPNPLTFDDLYTNLQTVGQLTGQTEAAAQLSQSLQQRVQAVEETVAGVEERPLVFYELDSSDPNAPWTSGPGTFIDFLIEKAGGANLGSSLEGAWSQVSIENLLELDPDVIVLGDYTWGGVTPEDVASRAGWETLTAVQNGQVFPFDDNLVSRPGPRMVEGLESMARLLHPDLFE